jgi:hypothetical protein
MRSARSAPCKRGDFFRGAILRRLHLFGGLQQATALGVDGQQAIDVEIDALEARRGANRFGIGANETNVQHRCSGPPRRSGRHDIIAARRPASGQSPAMDVVAKGVEQRRQVATDGDREPSGQRRGRV